PHTDAGDARTPISARSKKPPAPPPYRGRLGSEDAGNVDTAYRVIADHIRTLTFAITDGAVPSNEGRGYVLRRILRRAVRDGRQVMEAKTGFFAQLVPTVVGRMGEAFPELRKNPQRVIDILREEEESFGRTLDKGLAEMESALTELIRSPVTAWNALWSRKVMAWADWAQLHSLARDRLPKTVG